MKNRVDILPMYLEGTFESLPKGGLIPRRRLLAARIGSVLRYEELRARTRHLSPKEAYRTATAMAEAAVRGLALEATAPQPTSQEDLPLLALKPGAS